MDINFKIGDLESPGGLPLDRPGRGPDAASGFADTLEDALKAVDELQHESEAAQTAYARNEDVELHDVLIKIEEAEVAFKTMMEVRKKFPTGYLT